MRVAASWAFTLGAGLLVTVAGLALQLNILIVLTVALFVAGAVFYFIDYRGRHDGRIFLQGVDADALMKLYKERTEVQAEKAAAIYIGKWMRVTGTVRDIQRSVRRGRTVYLQERNTPSLHFKKGFGQLDILHRGDVIHAEGRVWAITGSIVILDDCEITATKSANPPSPA